MRCHQSSGNKEPMTFVRLCIFFFSFFLVAFEYKETDVIVTHANYRQLFRFRIDNNKENILSNDCNEII
jgi:hypothetical protein